MMISLELFLGLFGGYSVALCGLSTFLGKIWINRIQIKEQSRSQTQLAKLHADFNSKLSVINSKNEPIAHVSKIQFEKEYSHYETIWEHLPLLGQLIEMLIQAADKPKEFLSVYNNLGEMKDKQSCLVAKSAPFIDFDIYLKANESPEIISKQEPYFREHLIFLKNKLEKNEAWNAQDVIKIQKFKCETKKTHTMHHEIISKVAQKIRVRNKEMLVVNNVM